MSSSTSIAAPSRSRPQSTSFAAFHSSLPYALVRDFAYPPFDAMHYGPPPEPPSGATTPGSEWNRRLSDSEAWPGRSTGAWGGDGGMETEPEVFPGQSLPSTSFVGEDGDAMGDWERGRRRSSGVRKSRASGEGSDMFLFGASSSSNTSASLDPGGSTSLRHSRAGNPGRRDSHFAATLPNRSFPSARPSRSTTTPSDTGSEDLIPLDAEPSSSHAHSPQRASMGPEDELFAGESLALYAFEPENPNELRLKEGQIILVSYRHGQGWLVAEDPSTGEQGLVPEEYVRLVREIEGWDAEAGGFVEGDEENDGEAGVEEDSIMEDSNVEAEKDEDEPMEDVNAETEEPSTGVAEPVRETQPPPDETVQPANKHLATPDLRQDSAHAER
ncbi:HOG (high osmolarity glycerol) pathway protein [Oleoguttula sp. CCFEE 5521]